MANFFEVTDPRGCHVVCTEECWLRRILIENPEMEGAEGLVMEAIGTPRHSAIYRQRDFPNHLVYYVIHPSRKCYVKAVVRFSADCRGELITAFMPDSLRMGEKPLWTAPL
jgi:hypothetical protein